MNFKKEPNFIVRLQTDPIRNKVHEAIKTSNLPLVKELTVAHHLFPNEEISTAGHLWTCLHYACHFGSTAILDYLLKRTYQLYKNDYSNVVNCKSREGWNIAMIASMYGSDGCLALLLKYGGIRLYDKDNTGNRAVDLARKYSKGPATVKIISTESAIYASQGIAETLQFETPVQINLLMSDESQDDKQQVKIHPKGKEEVHGVSNSVKNHMHNAIKAGDLPQLKQIINLYKVKPTEEISTAGSFWNCLHYACHFGSVIILDYLLTQAYKVYKDDFPKAINAKTSEGWSVLMIACIYGSDGCFKLLLKYGGLKIYEKDNTGLRAVDLAKKYGRENIFKILTEYSSQYPPKVIVEPTEFITPVNTDLLNSCIGDQKESKPPKSNAADLEDRDEYRNLLKEGERLPCVICQGALGWLKYLDCCGNPIHPLCAKKIKICVSCGNKSMRLSTDVKVPEKAFVINPIDEVPIGELANLSIK